MRAPEPDPSSCQGTHCCLPTPLASTLFPLTQLTSLGLFLRYCCHGVWSSSAIPTPSPHTQLAREVCLHMRSCHPAITTLYAAYKDSRYIYLLMELAPSGNLYQMLMAMPVAPVSV